MSWILFSILASLFWAMANTIDKFVLTKWIKKPIVPIMVLGIVGLMASFIIFLFHGVILLSYLNIALSFVSGIFSILTIILYLKALKIEEMSRVVPLFYLTPLFVSFLAAIFLGELFTLEKYIGMIFLIIGAILISSKTFRKIKFGKAFWFMIMASFLWGVSTVIIKYLLNFADFWTIFSYTRIGTIFALIPIFYFNFSDLLSTVKKHGKKVIGFMSLSEITYITGLLFFVTATSLGYVTLVNALSSIQPLFVLLFAVILSVFYPKILKEETGKSTILLKLIAIILMFVGAILITWS